MMQTMRQKGIHAVMALGFVAAMALMAGPAQAASGNGPYYAEPAWSQKLPAATRFVVLTDWNSEAVLDRNTGLVWEKSPDASTQTWFSARLFCANRTTGGQKGWRVPSMPELASLVDPSVAQPGPTLPPGHPFTNVLSANYWSGATFADVPSAAWHVIFGNGNVFANDKAGSGLVWCVRGGSNADAY